MKTVRKILIADDDHDFRELIAEYLAGRGYNIVEACDGHEVFQKALDENPDIILLDVMMPRMNGIDVCRELKSDFRTRDSSIVMLTVKNRLSDKLTAYVAGAQRYLTKPCEMQDLDDCLQTVISQRNLNQFQHNQDIS